jgi:hypothetical protein
MPPTIYPAHSCTPRDLPILTRQHLSRLEAALAPLMEPKRPISLRSAQPFRKPETDFERRRLIACASAALEREAQALAMACKPGRNRALFDAVCRLGRYVHGGVLASDDLTSALSDACCRNKLIEENGRRDVMQTILRALNISSGDPLPELKERRA